MQTRAVLTAISGNDVEACARLAAALMRLAKQVQIIASITPFSPLWAAVHVRLTNFVSKTSHK
jgi:hypothetical protein